MTQDEQPKKWKVALLIWIFIYPMVTVLSRFLFPLLDGFAAPVKTLVMTAILVPIMAYWYIPFINKRFYKWFRNMK